MIIRQAVPEEAFAIAELENELFPEYSFNERTIEQLIGLGSVWVIAERVLKGLDSPLDAVDTDTLGGYGIIVSTDKLDDLIRFGIAPAFQRKGLGKTLLEGILRAYEGRPLMLTVRKSNSRAFDLYLRNGFKVIAHYEASWLMIKG